MGFVFQAFHLLPHLSVARNVGLPLALNGAAIAAIAARVAEMLAAVGMLDRQHDLPNQLSGGEMQRVAIARALAHRPSLVLADEPTGNLDADSAAEVLALLRAQLERDNAAEFPSRIPKSQRRRQRVYRLTQQGLHERSA